MRSLLLTLLATPVMWMIGMLIVYNEKISNGEIDPNKAKPLDLTTWKK